MKKNVNLEPAKEKKDNNKKNKDQIWYEKNQLRMKL